MTKLHFLQPQVYTKSKMRVRIRHKAADTTVAELRKLSAEAREREAVFRDMEEMTLPVEADATFSSLEDFLLKNVRTLEDVRKYGCPFDSLKTFKKLFGSMEKEDTLPCFTGSMRESMAALAEAMRAKRDQRFQGRFTRKSEELTKGILGISSHSRPQLIEKYENEDQYKHNPFWLRNHEEDEVPCKRAAPRIGTPPFAAQSLQKSFGGEEEEQEEAEEIEDEILEDIENEEQLHVEEEEDEEEELALKEEEEYESFSFLAPKGIAPSEEPVLQELHSEDVEEEENPDSFIEEGSGSPLVEEEE